MGWSDGGIIGLDIAMNYSRPPRQAVCLRAHTNVAGLKPNVDKDPVFAKYIENAGKEYARLSKTPTEFDPFVKQISEMWATQPGLQTRAARQDQVSGRHRRRGTRRGDPPGAQSGDGQSDTPARQLVILPGVSAISRSCKIPSSSTSGAGFSGREIVSITQSLSSGRVRWTGAGEAREAGKSSGQRFFWLEAQCGFDCHVAIHSRLVAPSRTGLLPFPILPRLCVRFDRSFTP